MSVNYLDLSSAKDLKNSGDRYLYRFFEILPAALAWSTLVFAFLFSWLIPFWVAAFIIVFDFYWLLRVVYLAFHQISSFRRMEKNIKIDWLKKLKKEKKEDWKRIHHLVILPFAKEEKEVVRSSILSLRDCRYPKEKMIVVLALEARAGEKAKLIAQELKKDYKGTFLSFFISVHPKDIPGEAAGKGSNVNWAFKEIKENLLPKLTIAAEDIVVSLFDIDTKPYQQYFSCLTWNFLDTKDPLKKSYQPIPIYNNNIWEAAAFSRIIATSSTFWQMMQQERAEQLVTFSSHSMPLVTLLEVGYPSNVVSDDSRIFWRSYFQKGGDYKVFPLHYPVSMDAVMAESLFKTMVNQYKQQRRWSWGVENVPYVLFNFLKNPASKKIKLQEKIFHSLTMLEGFWSWSTCSVLIFCLGWLPILLGGQEFSNTLLSYNLPRLTSRIMTVSMVGMVVSGVISMLLLPPKPAKYGRAKNLSMILQWLFLPVTLIVFGSIPALESQTRMMINKPLIFWVTEKVRK
jgi:hypothetical protein